MKSLRLVLAMTVVAAAQIVVGVLLYGSTVGSNWCETVAIDLPLACALAAQVVILLRSGLLPANAILRRGIAVIGALAAAIGAMLGMFAMAFDKYGS